MKRYCQTLELINDPFLIAEYEHEHQQVWPEVIQGMKQVGILDMQIFRYENNLFMIVDTEDDFDWEKDMSRLATLPRQEEWESHVARYQKVNPWATSAEKWKRMDKIFELESK